MNDRNSRAAGPHPKAGPAPQNAGEDRAPRLPEPEDFWLELGPASAYYGMDAYDTALREGDASPDAKRLGWTGAEPGKGSLDDVPPQDR